MEFQVVSELRGKGQENHIFHVSFEKPILEAIEIAQNDINDYLTSIVESSIEPDPHKKQKHSEESEEGDQ
ncbi:unnamed protein product [Blepharisma stoltei]|uniref:RNA polymerase alpha subunit n=1 Tax=Blepharisma stoltei TaxID=1481888 RepID=A0AAU9K8M4_9CILI|nr:unnamed protein product [Blepharisma stoltei]